MTVNALKDRVREENVIVAEGPGQLPCLQIRTELASATVYLHGAHVTEFTPAGAEPLLFVSEKSAYQTGRPIRGGVPVCWPWFGPKSDDPSAPMHGFARLQQWALESVKTLDGGEVEIAMVLLPSDLSRRSFPYDFKLEHRIRIGPTLTMSLITHNTDAQPFVIHEALHTYLKVGDVRRVGVHGLQGFAYTDKTRNQARFTEDQPVITIASETDRHYLGTDNATLVDDPSMGRKIRIDKRGSRSTVVWNPWIAKAAAMPDFGDDEWPGMLCVETANACDDAVTVAPGTSHEMQAIIGIESSRP